MSKQYEIRKSSPNAESGTEHGSRFYYLLEIDEDGNQKLLIQDDSLAVVQAHEAIKGQDLKPVAESKTRGQITE